MLKERVDPEKWDPQYSISRLPEGLGVYFRNMARQLHTELKQGSVTCYLVPIEAYGGFTRHFESTNPAWYKDLWHAYERMRSDKKGDVYFGTKGRKKGTRPGVKQSKINKRRVLNALERIAEGEDRDSVLYSRHVDTWEKSPLSGKRVRGTREIVVDSNLSQELMRGVIYEFLVSGRPVNEYGDKNTWRDYHPDFLFIKKAFGLDDNGDEDITIQFNLSL